MASMDTPSISIVPLIFVQVNYISEEEAERSIQVSAEERVFQGKLWQPFLGENYYTGHLDPILPLEQRASDHSDGYYGYVYVIERDDINSLEYEGFLKKSFFEITFSFREVPRWDGVNYRISLNRDAAGIFFRYANYIKLF